MSRDRLPYILIPVAALIAILPLILQGPSCGHDFTFHLLNWFEAAAQFRHGNLHPQWAVSPAWNAGEPRFVFYPPLSWTLGAILGLILPWTWTPIAYTGLALTASGLAMHRLARANATPTAALLASTLYLANPYMLFTAYERTAYAELLAAAFLPLLIHAILKPRPTIPSIAIPLALLWLTNAPAAVMSTYTLALLALIRLSKTRAPHPSQPHRDGWSPSATAPGQAEARVPHPSQPHRDGWGLSVTTLRLAATITGGTLLGLSLAAFYILPAAIERPLVQIAMVVIPGMRIDDNTLFHHTGQTEDALAHDAVLHTASLIALTLLTLTAAALLLTRIPRSIPKERPTQQSLSSFREAGVPASQPASSSPPTQEILSSFRAAGGPAFRPAANLSLIILTATITLLLTPLTLPIWHHAPELAFLQFPWRLLAIQAVALSLAAALAVTAIQNRSQSAHPIPKQSSLDPNQTDPPRRETTNLPIPTILTTLTLAATVTAAAYTTFHQPCDPEDTVQTRRLAFDTHQGAEPTDEYTPTQADNDSLPHTDPPFWLSPNPDAPPPPGLPSGPAPRDLTLTAPTPEYLILNLRQYPAWQVTLNNRNLPESNLTQTPRADGLLTLPIPAGPTQLHLTYHSTPLERTAEALSTMALLITLTLLHRNRRQRRTSQLTHSVIE